MVLPLPFSVPQKGRGTYAQGYGRQEGKGHPMDQLGCRAQEDICQGEEPLPVCGFSAGARIGRGLFGARRCSCWTAAGGSQYGSRVWQRQWPVGDSGCRIRVRCHHTGGDAHRRGPGVQRRRLEAHAATGRCEKCALGNMCIGSQDGCDATAEEASSIQLGGQYTPAGNQGTSAQRGAATSCWQRCCVAKSDSCWHRSLYGLAICHDQAFEPFDRWSEEACYSRWCMPRGSQSCSSPKTCDQFVSISCRQARGQAQGFGGGRRAWLRSHGASSDNWRWAWLGTAPASHTVRRWRGEGVLRHFRLGSLVQRWSSAPSSFLVGPLPLWNRALDQLDSLWVSGSLS